MIFDFDCPECGQNFEIDAESVDKESVELELECPECNKQFSVATPDMSEATPAEGESKEEKPEEATEDEAEAASPEEPESKKEPTATPASSASSSSSIPSKVSPAEAEPVPTGELLVVSLMDKMLASTSGTLTPQFFASTTKAGTNIGYFCLFLAAIAGVANFLFSCPDTPMITRAYRALAWVAMVFVFQYLAILFLRLGRDAIKSMPTAVSTDTVFKCSAVSSFVGGFVLLLGFISYGLNLGRLTWVAYGVGLFFLALFLTSIGLNPSVLNIKVAPNKSPAEDAIGISSFIAKSLLSIVPILFGVLVVGGTVGLVVATVPQLLGKGPDPTACSQLALIAIKMVAAGALLPAIAYLLFILFSLKIRVIQAILKLPELLQGALSE